VTSLPLWALGDVTEKIGSGATPRGGANVYRSIGVALIRSQNVLDNTMKCDEIARISDDAASMLKSVTVEPGDVLINITGDSIARCSVVDPNVLPARVNQHVAIIRTAKQLDSRFLQRVLVSPFYKMSLLGLSDGGTRRALTKRDLMGLLVPCPPLPEQEAIAEVLGALDDKIAVNRRLSRTCRDLAKAEFSSVVRGASDTTSVGELIKSGALVMSDGYRTKRSELGTAGYRIIRVADIEDDSVNFDGPDFVSDKYAAAIGSKVGKPGDILLSTKGTVGRVAVLPQTANPVVYSPQLCFFRVNSEHRVTRRLLQLWLSSDEFKEQASYRMNNTDMAPYINLVDIRSLRMTLPRIEDQLAIGGILDSLEERSQASRLENQMLASMRDALLPELVSGRIRVKDAEKRVGEVL
jgi:type I restriction enzyme S subunit